MAKINENAQALLEKRYFLKDETSWDDICDRVAINIAHAEEDPETIGFRFEEFYDAMYNLDFVPSTPCLLNAGTSTQQLSSCFILDIEDSIEGIMNTLAECAKIFQKSGGCGFNISALRPKGSPLGNSGGFASGPVSFMRLFNQLVEEVKHGNSRKGAIKIDLDVSHPDIMEFINCKNDTTQLNNMNISVSISDNFMMAVNNDDSWTLEFNGKVYTKLKAREIWDAIIKSAHSTGEPGLSFVDKMNEFNMNPHLGMITSTNPCAEYVNVPYSSCNLGSINLLNCVYEEVDGVYEFCYGTLEKLVNLGVNFLDNMITMNKLPLPKIQEVTDNMRPIGLGTMGLADTMFKLGLSMASQEGIEFIHELYENLSEFAIVASMRLGEEKGSYPAFKGSKWDTEYHLKHMRNSNLLSIAPNGSIGFIAGVNGGIEPVFALVMTRTTQDGDEYFIVNQIFKEVLEDNGIPLTDALLKKIANNNGSVQGIDEIPGSLQWLFVTAMDMTPEQHLKVLEAVSTYVDLAVSKTINLPNEATVKDVSEIYMSAWKTGVIKGLTVYRDGSRQFQVLSTKKEEPTLSITEEELETLPRGFVKIAPDVSNESRTAKLHTGCGSMYLNMTKDEDGQIDQTFVSRGSTGTCLSNQTAVSRLISLALRGGIPIESVIDQLRSVPVCPAYYGKRCKGGEVSPGSSCPGAIAFELERYAKAESFAKPEPPLKAKYVGKPEKSKTLPCPDCKEPMITSEGCITCPSCGFSKCN